MLSDDAIFFVLLSWLYYHWNVDLENIQYCKLLVSCKYYDYCHFEHHFRENAKFGATTNSKNSKGSIIEEEEMKKILKTYEKIFKKVA